MRSIRIPCPKTDTPYGEIFYPGLVVAVLLTSGYQPFEFILDSGADCTMVPRYLSDLVGIQLPDLPDTYIGGISGKKMPAYKGELRMKLRTEEFDIRCVFTRSNRTPFLLGRVDFFSLFDVCFDAANCRIILKRLD